MDIASGACKRLGRILADSINLILLLGCAVLVLIEVVTLVGLVREANVAEAIGAPITWSDYALSIALLLTGLLGCYGAYYNESSSIKVFAVAVGVCAIIVMVRLCLHSNAATLKLRNDKIFESLYDDMPHYDWTSKGTYERSKEATKRWNHFQMSLWCCGIDSPSDWDGYRPATDVSSDTYPGSCCWPNFPQHQLDPGLCKLDEIVKVGCRKRVSQLEKVNIIATSFYIAFLFLLFAISLFCLYLRGACRRGEDSEPIAPPETPATSESALTSSTTNVEQTPTEETIDQ